ncbi:MAG: aminotransferase class I/II-fold pyridoxal phosphate-dependent enzyme [Gemmatimonadota bacterium]|nr:MAG: aminotransferase class I/II-fold pyridoxal phosphate-dependent enzyme [Gemmatimonadota bacterium]
MERRDFLRTGVALGAGIGAAGVGGVGILTGSAHAFPKRSDGPLQLNSNENPLGLAPAARRAVIDGIADANRYPDVSRVEFIEALAALNGVRTENIVPGCGSTEVLQMAVQALATPDARLILAEPTFEDVPWYCGPLDYRLEKVPLDARFAHDLGRMQERAAAAPGRVLIYVCNPNNPTGTLTPSAEVDAWIESAPENTYFLVDEAYYEYCEDPGYWSCVKWIADRPNVIVTRSFSKIYAMAGMRLGYGIAHPETAGLLRRYIGRNNANHLALVAAVASLRDPELIGRSRQANTGGKQILCDCLDQLGLEYLPSHTNFVLHRITGDLRTYRTRMREHDIFVGRPFPPMLEYNRLSIGSLEEMERFTEVLREFRDNGWV